MYNYNTNNREFNNGVCDKYKVDFRYFVKIDEAKKLFKE